jgi:hypothetical protein
MKPNEIVIIGNGKKTVECCSFFKKYGFDVLYFVSQRGEEAPGGIGVFKFSDNSAKEIASKACPVVFAADNTHFCRRAKDRLAQMGVPQSLLIEDSILWSPDMEELIDALSFNSKMQPNEYVKCLLERYPQSARDMIGTLAAYQVEKIKKDIDPGRKTLAVYYPSKAYRSNLGGEGMYNRIREKGYNAIFLFGVIRDDEYEKRPYSYYAGHDIVGYLDFIDVFVLPTLTPDLPERSKKVLFVHDIYDSPKGRAEAPRKGADGKPERVSPLIDELDYTFLPSRSIMPKSNVCPLIRKKPLCRIPGGYIKLDRNLRYFENHKVPTDSIIYAPTVCGDEFENYVSLPKYGEQIVGALLDNFPDYRIIFRPHPHTLDTEYVANIEKRFRDNERFVLDSDASFYMDNYCRSAVMVTDMSGTAFTYAFTTLRPVVFFSHSEDTVKDVFGNIAYFKDREKVGFVVSNMEELTEKVALGLSKMKEFEEEIRKFRDLEIFNIGKTEEYFAENFHHIVEGTKNDDWQYVVSPIVPAEDQRTKPEPIGLAKKLAHSMVAVLRTGGHNERGPGEPILVEAGYKGFNIIRLKNNYYGLAQNEGAFDLRKYRLKKYNNCFSARTIDEVRLAIDESAAKHTQPVLVEGGYEGYNIIYCAGKYYALAQGEGAFDIGKADRNEYKRCVVGSSTDQVKQAINQSVVERMGATGMSRAVTRQV